MRTKIAWGLMTFLSLGIVLFASRYLTLNPDAFFPEQRATYLAHEAGLIAHIVGAMLALALGPFQFLQGLRTRHRTLHRWMGCGYLTGVLLGGVGGLYMAPFAYTGWVTGLSFGILAVLWLTTGALAYRHIRRGAVREHEHWMMRNFALTLAGVMLRVQSPLLSWLGLDFAVAYQIVAWSCWLPNLLVAEWLIRRRQPATPRWRATSAQVAK